jgi:hypothetical protein
MESNDRRAPAAQGVPTGRSGSAGPVGPADKEKHIMANSVVQDVVVAPN